MTATTTKHQSTTTRTRGRIGKNHRLLRYVQQRKAIGKEGARDPSVLKREETRGSHATPIPLPVGKGNILVMPSRDRDREKSAGTHGMAYWHPHAPPVE